MCKLAKYVRNCVVFWKNLHSWPKFYTTAGRDSRDKFQVWSQCSLFWSLLRLTMIVITIIMIEGAREAGATHMWAVWEAVCSVLQPEDTLENTFGGLCSQDEIRNWKKGIRRKCSNPKTRPDKTITTILFQLSDEITSILFQVKPFQCRHDPSACRVAFTTKQCLQVTMSFCHHCKISA